MIFRKKKVTRIILIVGAILLLLAIWYKYTYSMDVASEYGINNPTFQKKLLIATQGSNFKDAITNSLVDNYKQDSIYIKVIDISSLQKVALENYNAIVLIHTWENWKPPSEVKLFIDKNIAFQDKMIVMTTSGEGSFKMKNVDAITGESKLENVEFYSNKIIEGLKPLLNN